MQQQRKTKEKRRTLWQYVTAQHKRAKKSASLDVDGMNVIGWLWEFSKKVVVLSTGLYLVAFMYSLLMCYKAILLVGDATALDTLITETNETFRVVVGGYLVKAGIENACKIIVYRMSLKNPQAKSLLPDDDIAPQEGAGGLMDDADYAESEETTV